MDGCAKLTDLCRKLYDVNNISYQAHSMKILLLLLLSLTSLVHAASFDCAKAATDVERKICNNEKLSGLDAAMGEIYERELSRDSAAKQIRAAQKAWLDTRNRCNDIACLEAKYEQRIADLACDKESIGAGSGSGSSMCTSFLIRLVERELSPLQEKFVGQVVGQSNNPDYAKRVLIAEEKAWRDYRHAQCALYGETEGGSDAWKNAFAASCMLDETKKRLAERKKDTKGQ